MGHTWPHLILERYRFLKWKLSYLTHRCFFSSFFSLPFVHPQIFPVHHFIGSVHIDHVENCAIAPYGHTPSCEYVRQKLQILKLEFKRICFCFKQDWNTHTHTPHHTTHTLTLSILMTVDLFCLLPSVCSFCMKSNYYEEMEILAFSTSQLVHSLTWL